MFWTLALRHLLVKPVRAAILLGGYALGVGVMIVLLSIGDAMLDQSADASLIGGGQLTALPEGVDVEALRSGGLGGMFFGIDGARFVTRELIGGPRYASIVAAASPELEQKLLLLRTRHTTWAVRAGGEIPTAAAATGVPLQLIAGRWIDGPADSAWRAPTAQVFYDEIDRFHQPVAADSSWAEWDYFKIAINRQEWWYITLLVAGNLDNARSRGQILVTHRQPDGRYQRYITNVSREAVHFDTARADLVVGPASVVQRDGVYRVHDTSAAVSFDITLNPARRQYFPPVEPGDNASASGYVVPALAGTSSGRICIARSCEMVDGASAYHDHNWGDWRAVTWEWGTGRGAGHDILYGGLIPGQSGSSAVPFFLALEDSLGVQQIYRFDSVAEAGTLPVPSMPGVFAPGSLRILGTRRTDTLRLTVAITDVAATHSIAAGPDRVFLQMRGRWEIAGTAAGREVADSGDGAFETWVRSSTLTATPFSMRAHVRQP